VGRAKTVTVDVRKRRWKLVTESEKAAARLWCEIWGGRVLGTPRFEPFDFFWCDRDLIIGALEVKTMRDLYSETSHCVKQPRPVIIPASKYFAAVALEAQALALYLVVVLEEEVLWAPVLEGGELRLVRNLSPGAKGHASSRLELAAIYDYNCFRRLSGQPLFDERDAGGKRWMVPT